MATKRKLSEIEKRAFVIKHYKNNIPLYFAKKNHKEGDFIEKVEDLQIDELLQKFSISKKEVKKILKEELDNIIFEPTEKELCWFLKNHVEYIQELPDGAFTPEVILFLLRNCGINGLAEVDQRGFMNEDLEFEFLIHNPKHIDNIEVTEEILCEALEINLDIFKYLRKEQVTQKILYKFLQFAVRKKYLSNEHLSFDNVSEDLKDKIFFQGCVQSGIKYLEFCPKEFISEKLILWSLSHQKEKLPLNFNLFSIIPDEKVSNAVATQVCLFAPRNIANLPERFRNRDFYESLVKQNTTEHTFFGDFNNFSFSDVSYETVIWELQRLKGIREKCSYYSQIHMYENTIPKDYWTEEFADLYAELFYDFQDVAPKSVKTEERIWRNYNNHRGVVGSVLGKRPKITKDNLDEYMKKTWKITDDIPKELINDEFWKKYIPNCTIQFADIPKEYKTKEVLDMYIEKKPSISFSSIPRELVTEDVIEKLYQKGRKVYETGKIGLFHYDQSYQDDEITEMIIKCILKHDDIHTVFSNLYLLPFISDERVDQLLEAGYSNQKISSQILNHRIPFRLVKKLCDLDYTNLCYFTEEQRNMYLKSLEGEQKVESEVASTEKEIMESNKEDSVSAEEIFAKQNKEKEEEVELFDTFTQLSIFDLLIS